MIEVVKKCIRCNQFKTLGGFYGSHRRRTKPICRDCILLETRPIRIKPSKEVKIKVRAKTGRTKSNRPPPDKRIAILKKYNLTIEQYDSMVLAQQGLCLICNNPPLTNRILMVDHCHLTNKVRGLLCHHCNSGIGLSLRNPIYCISAAEYLVKHG